MSPHDSHPRVTPETRPLLDTHCPEAIPTCPLARDSQRRYCLGRLTRRGRAYAGYPAGPPPYFPALRCRAPTPTDHQPGVCVPPAEGWLVGINLGCGQSLNLTFLTWHVQTIWDGPVSLPSEVGPKSTDL